MDPCIERPYRNVLGRRSNALIGILYVLDYFLGRMFIEIHLETLVDR